MITFSLLGKYGRLGNQMFQYAAIIGIAKHNNYDYCFPLNNTDIIKHFELTALNKFYNCEKILIDQFSYNSKILNLSDEIDYVGYFQSEKYFQHCSDFIKKEFTFKKEITNKIDNEFKDSNSFISVHVRRGDYLHLNEIHPIPTLEWFKMAMAQFPNKKFLFFSDDINWCKENFPNNYFSPYQNEGEDMYAMSKCDGHIIANSSFSWWGAWLSGKKTIAPKIWFGVKGPQDWQDIYCSDWVIL